MKKKELKEKVKKTKDKKQENSKKLKEVEKLVENLPEKVTLAILKTFLADAKAVLESTDKEKKSDKK